MGNTAREVERNTAREGDKDPSLTKRVVFQNTGCCMPIYSQRLRWPLSTQDRLTTRISIPVLPSCHGPSLDDDKAPALGLGSSLDDKAPITMPAAIPAAPPIARLPTVAIGKHDLSFELHSIQDLNALADAVLL